MGITVLSGLDLLYYAVSDLRDHRPADVLIRATRATVQRLMAQYRIDTLAYEKTFYVQSKNSALLQVQEGELRRVGKVASLRVVGYSPTHVRRMLCADGRATKEIVARVLTERYSHLDRYLGTTNLRQQTYWLHMFDALAVGVVCAETLTRESSGRREETAAV